MGIYAPGKFYHALQRAFQQQMCIHLLILMIGIAAGAGVAAAQMTDKNLSAPVEKMDRKEGNAVDDNERNPEQDSTDQKQPENETAAKTPEKISDETTYPEIRRDLSTLPFPVRRMRELILEAALSGDIEKLRPLIGYGDDVTMLSLGGIEEDPLSFLKSLAGDENGHEILAILAEVLETGYVRVDEGSDEELYVWPYFFAWPLDKLTPPQKVELYRLVTYGDYIDMESFGAYIFYRLGITPQGRWRFFVAGD